MTIGIRDYDIDVNVAVTESGWAATAVLPDGQKVISGPAATRERAVQDVVLQAEARLYPMKQVDFTRKFESMDKEQAIVEHRANNLVENPEYRHTRIIGREMKPPRASYDDPDAEMDIATKSGFTAWEYADRTGKHHPRLLKAVTGGPYEPLYRRRFKLGQDDRFYERVMAEADQLLEAPVVEASFHSPEEQHALEHPERYYHARVGDQRVRKPVPQYKNRSPAELAKVSQKAMAAVRGRLPAKKAAFYPSDGGSGGGGGGITSV